MRLRERTTLTTTTTTRRTGKIVCCTRAVCSMMILPRPSSRKILRTWRRESVCGFDDSSEARKKCVVFVVLFVLPFQNANCAKIRATRRYRDTDDGWFKRIHQFTIHNSRRFHPHLRRVGDVRA
jgi:hypothetical protein